MRMIPALVGVAFGTMTATTAQATSLCTTPIGTLVDCSSGRAASSASIAVDGIEFRSYDGTGNNLANSDWGASNTGMLTAIGASNSTTNDMTRTDGPAARDVSTAMGTGSGDVGDAGLSSMFWAWGQFVDHDITLTAESHDNDQIALGGTMGSIDRATQSDGAGINQITAYIDASGVYGSDEETALALRTNDGTGRMLMGEDGNLPRDADGNFMAGDVRVNEQQQLITMHTVFTREHNRIADTLSDANPDWSGERVYQESRSLVGAQIQSITYNEWLPNLLGENGLNAYGGYDSGVNAGMTTEFSTCAFRFCHSMIPDELERLAENGDPIAQGHLKLSDGFFSPEIFLEGGGVDPLLRGLAAQDAMAVDAAMTTELRNFLDRGDGEDGDLLASNVARGRDLGLADYNVLRAAYGLDPIDTWGDLTDDPVLAAELEALYGTSLNGLDPFIGALAENPLDGAIVGALNAAIIGDQFERLRSGDRFWYETLYEGEMLTWIEDRSFSDILLDNSDIVWLQDNVFITAARGAVSEPMPLALFVVALAMLARRRRYAEIG